MATEQPTDSDDPQRLETFVIETPESVIADLQRRLGDVRWPNEIEGADWRYGTDLAYLQDICSYWRDEFDWYSVESELNAYEHVRTVIDGQSIHAMIARSPQADARPLLLTHGWPGSIVEFLDVIEPLRDPASHGGDPADAFHVVAPSLPGFGWSGPTRRSGWDVKAVAHAWAELMHRLGYERYFAQGGDWGSMVSTWLGLIDSQHLAAVHLNMAIGIPAEGELSEEELADLAAATEFLQTGCAYQEIQGKNPQTLAYGLSDSPAGLAGWILEKFWAWTDNDGDIEDAVSRDRLLANLTVYWVTNTIGSSVRLYFESMKTGRFGTQEARVEVPTGVALFPKEIIKAPRPWLEAGYDLVHLRRFDRGGHFAALEEPDLFVDEVRTFFRPYRER